MIKTANRFLPVFLLALTACNQSPTGQKVTETGYNKDSSADYKFLNGYPTAETVQKAYDEADLNRAIQVYRFFYPSVSIMATWKGNLAGGVIPNKVFAI